MMLHQCEVVNAGVAASVTSQHTKQITSQWRPLADSSHPCAKGPSRCKPGVCPQEQLGAGDVVVAEHCIDGKHQMPRQSLKSGVRDCLAI